MYFLQKFVEKDIPRSFKRQKWSWYMGDLRKSKLADARVNGEVSSVYNDFMKLSSL